MQRAYSSLIIGRCGLSQEEIGEYVRGKQTIVRYSQHWMSISKEQMLERLVLDINTLVKDVEHCPSMTVCLMSWQPFLEHIYNMIQAWLPFFSSCTD